MRTRPRRPPPPPTRAASMYSLGTVLKYWRMKKMPKALSIPGTISPR